jgi:hypothetical protein
MASIRPFDTAVVGNATITMLSMFTSNEFSSGGPVHKVYLQTAATNTNSILVKVGGKTVAVLTPPPTDGPLPEHFMTADENVGNGVDLAQITLTGTHANDAVNGYVTQT